MNGSRRDDIIDLTSNISSKLNYAFSSLHELLKAPLESLVMAFLVFRELGMNGSLGSMAILLVILPLQCEKIYFEK